MEVHVIWYFVHVFSVTIAQCLLVWYPTVQEKASWYSYGLSRVVVGGQIFDKLFPLGPGHILLFWLVRVSFRNLTDFLGNCKSKVERPIVSCSPVPSRNARLLWVLSCFARHGHSHGKKLAAQVTVTTSCIHRRFH